MTWSGALMSSIANSTRMVTQRQQGQMHESSNLQLVSIQKPFHSISCFRLNSQKRRIYSQRAKEMSEEGWLGFFDQGTYPTIQMRTPTIERRRERKAKGRPSSQPSGRHSQSQSQHILLSPSIFDSLILILAEAADWEETSGEWDL